MTATDRWIQLVMGLADAIGSYRALADKLRLHENSVLRWADGAPASRDNEGDLAPLLKLPREELARLLDDVKTERLARRLERQRLSLVPPAKAEVPSPLSASRPRPSAVARPPKRHTRAKGTVLGMVLGLVVVAPASGSPASSIATSGNARARQVDVPSTVLRKYAERGGILKSCGHRRRRTTQPMGRAA